MRYEARATNTRSSLLKARIDIETIANGAPEVKIKVKQRGGARFAKNSKIAEIFKKTR